MNLDTIDPEVAELIRTEEVRQQTTINLIPSENITSPAVREAVGSVLMHKYSEGNVGKRYYEGNKIIDQLEQLTHKRVRELFNLPTDWASNVQALSGSNANLAVYIALLEPGDTILSLHLPDGGHLSHGWKSNFTGKIYNVIQYRVNPDSHLIDLDELKALAEAHSPKMIITGGTAYPQDIPYAEVKKIAQSVGAYYLADIAHEAGLIAAGVLPTPVGVADVVTMTTHKTLRAARGAIILAKEDIISKVNKAILPGLQGGPFNNNIAGICVGLGEALQPEFKTYAQTVLANAKSLAKALHERGFTLISNGTEKHLILIDVSKLGLDGNTVAKRLAEAGIILNMNTIPGEQGTPMKPSGIRLGTPLVTTQGMKPEHMEQIAEWIWNICTVEEGNLSELQGNTKTAVQEFMQKFLAG